MLSDELTRLLLHGHAGIVAHFLPEAGQGVKERGLAAIGIADHGIGLRLAAHGLPGVGKR